MAYENHWLPGFDFNVTAVSGPWRPILAHGRDLPFAEESQLLQRRSPWRQRGGVNKRRHSDLEDCRGRRSLSTSFARGIVVGVNRDALNKCQAA